MKQKILDEGQRVTGVITAGRDEIAGSKENPKVRFKMFYTSPFTGETVEMSQWCRRHGDYMPHELVVQMFEYSTSFENLGRDFLIGIQGRKAPQAYPHGRFAYTWAEDHWKILNVPIKLQAAVTQVDGKEVAVVDWEKTFSDANIADIGGLPRTQYGN